MRCNKHTGKRLKPEEKKEKTPDKWLFRIFIITALCQQCHSCMSLPEAVVSVYCFCREFWAETETYISLGACCTVSPLVTMIQISNSRKQLIHPLPLSTSWPFQCKFISLLITFQGIYILYTIYIILS